MVCTAKIHCMYHVTTDIDKQFASILQAFLDCYKKITELSNQLFVY